MDSKKKSSADQILQLVQSANAERREATAQIPISRTAVATFRVLPLPFEELIAMRNRAEKYGKKPTDADFRAMGEENVRLMLPLMLAAPGTEDLVFAGEEGQRQFDELMRFNPARVALVGIFNQAMGDSSHAPEEDGKNAKSRKSLSVVNGRH